MVRRCVWGTCRNDKRLPHLWKRNANGNDVFFVRFPSVRYEGERRERWIKACHRGDNFNCTKNSYICSLHFVGENGPTLDNPDPISAVTGRKNVRIFIDYTLF